MVFSQNDGSNSNGSNLQYFDPTIRTTVRVGIISFIPGGSYPSREGVYNVTVESALVYPTVKIDGVLLPDADPLSVKSYSKVIADIQLTKMNDWNKAKTLGLEYSSFPNDSEELYQAYFESHSLAEAKTIALQQAKELQALLPTAKWDGVLHETNLNSVDFPLQ